MVSRRVFFSICIMMAVILILFQFSMFMREMGNNYDVNHHLPEEEEELKESDSWIPNKTEGFEEAVVYIGSSDDATAEIVSQWCDYTKRDYFQCDSIGEYEEVEDFTPLFLCIKGSEISSPEQVTRLITLALKGQSMVFCDLPKPAYVKNLPGFSELLGVEEVVEEETELVGIKLFSGFLLGGETIYQAKTEKEQKMQDLDLKVPWYMTLRRTKTYMVGLLEDEEVKNEELPSIIWRNSYGKARVFAVNGDYMHDQTGLGILSAMVYETQGYDLYPVVNAQNLSVANFPDFALENTEEMMNIYARNLRRFQMDLMWPNLIAATHKENYKMTAFFSPQLDYSVNNEQYPSDLVFYLKQLNEQQGEAGLSLDSLQGTDLEQKIKKDQAFFDESESKYVYGAAYVSGEKEADFLQKAQSGVLGKIQTITGVREGIEPLLSYFTDDIIWQSATADGFNHTYSQDLKVKAIETTLAYSNILVDMKTVSWPEKDAEHWEILSEAFSININAYWQKFSAFQKTTLSESNGRVRSFLAVDYKDERKDDTITVDIRNRNREFFFLLRTHSERIDEITGGSYEEVEEDVYLIHAEENTLKIKLEDKTKTFYYFGQER